MRLLRLLTGLAALSAALWIVTPAFSQSFLETQQDAERRRQAEQYNYEKEQQRRGNLLPTEKPRGLGEASPRSPSTHPTGRSDNDNPNWPRECPPNQMICRPNN